MMSESTLDPTESRAGAEFSLSWITVEVVLYAALASSAFFLRFFLLGNLPLDSNEARQALASWDFIHGIPNSFTGSPLLFFGNALLFALVGATDAAARFFPALAGTALVLLPALLRQYLGRVGALLASALFVFSPTLLLFSRQAGGVILAMACALATVAFAWRYLSERRPRDSYLAAAFLALALLAASQVWTVILAALAFLLWVRFSRQPLTSLGLDARRVALAFALVFVGVSTAFLLHRDGLGAA
ncbi:MAG TPA: glycosyltransferase family 39 protein, partial [Anaerolineae bacterium]